MKKYLIVSIVCFVLAGIASLGFTDQYEYIPGDYGSEDSVAGNVVKTMTVAEMKAKYFALRDEKAYQQELIQNAVTQRDSAIAAGQSAQARIAEINSEMAALKAAYEAWVEAADVPEPTEQ